MAALIPPFLASAFERMGSGNKFLEQITVNTQKTATSVSVGGDLYKKIDELVKALKGGKASGGSSKLSIKEALVLRITSGALEPIGLGLGIIVDSLNRAPDGEELKIKMEALTNGLLSLGDVGWSILKFAGLMILALPLLILAGLAMIVTVPLIKLMVDGLMWATKKLTKKGLKNIAALGDVGKALMILSVSLVLVALLAPYALKGLLVAGAILLGFGLMLMVLDKMGLDPKGIKKLGNALKSLALGLLGLSLTLVLIGFIGSYVLAGLGTAVMVVLTIGAMFWLLDKMQVDKSMKKTGLALIFAAGAILSVSIALVLSHLILGSIGFEEVAKVMLIVAGIAVVFGVIGLAGKQIRKGAKALIFAAGAIVALSVAIWIMQMVLGNMTGDDVLTSYKVLAVIAGIGIVMAVAGLAHKQIKKGAIAMGFAAISLIAIGIGVAVMGWAVKDLEWKHIGMMGAIIGGLAVAFGVAGIGPIPLAIVLGSAAMAVAGLALLPIGLGVSVFGAAIKDLTWEHVGMMGAIVVGVGLAMAGAGLASPFIIAGSAAMAIAGGALFAIGKGITPLASINFKKLFTGTGLFAPSGQETEGFMGIGGGRPKTYLEVMIESMRDSFALNPFTIPLVIAGSAAMILVGKALNSIAIGLVEFQKLSEGIDTNVLAVNVMFMTSILSETFARIGNKHKGGFLFGSNPVADGIKAVMGMGAALTNIAVGMQNMANLRFPVEYDKDGKPTKYESMDSDAPVRVAANAAMITRVLAKVFGDIGTEFPGGKKSLWESVFGGGTPSPVADGISAVMGMGGALTGVALGFQAMANLNFPIAWDKEGKPTKYAKISNLSANAQRVADNTKLIVTALSGTFAEIGAGKTSKWWQGSTSFEKGTKVVNALGLPLKNLAEGVQNMADMKFADGYDADGKATGWTSLSDMKPGALKKKIGTNTQLLIEALTDTFTAIGGGKSKTSSWWQGTTAFEKGIEVISLISEPYKKLSSVVKELVAFKDIDSTKIKNDLQNLVAGFTTVGETSDANTLFNATKLAIAVGDTYAKMSNAIPAIANAKMDSETGDIFSNLLFGRVDAGDASVGYYNQMKMQHALAATYGKAGENFPKIQGAINSLDLTKLTESRKMFEALAVLSEGGSPGDILSAMGESLESAMQRLADMLQEFKGSVEEGNTSSNSAFEGIKDAVSSVGAAMNPLKDKNTAAAEPAKMPSKMTVTLDQSSIDALKENGFGGGNS